MKHWTLRRKIVSFVLVVMTVFLVARTIGDARQLYNVYLHFVIEEVRGTGDTLAVAISQGGYWDDPDRMQELLSTLHDQAGPDGRDVLVVDTNGRVLAATDSRMSGSVLPADVQRTLHEVIDQGAATSLGMSDATGTTNQFAVPIQVDGQTKGTLLVEYHQSPARLLAGASARSEVFIFVVMTMGLVLVLLVGLRKMVLQPLAVLEEGAAHFGKGDLDARIALRTGDELETVADAFNRMAGALKVYHAKRIAQEKQATLVEVACATACELSQPLTVVLGYAELLHEQDVPSPELLDEAVESIQRGSQQMTAIVRQLSSMSGGQGVPGSLLDGRPPSGSNLAATTRPSPDEQASIAGMLGHVCSA